MKRGQIPFSVVVGIGSAVTAFFVSWNSWLSFVAFNDHADIASIKASVDYIKDVLHDQVVPSLSPVKTMATTTIVKKHGT